MSGANPATAIRRTRTSLTELRLERLAVALGMGPLARALIVEGAIELKRLGAALRFVVARHESLRTTFGSEGSGVFQRIDEEPAFAATFVELTNPSDLHEAVRQEVARPFDAASGPLFRATLFRLTGERHLLLLVLDRRIADEQSMDVLVYELSTVYSAECRGQRAELPDLSVDYSQVVEEDEQALTAERVREAVAHYRAVLADSEELLELPLDVARPSVFTHQGARRALDLDPSLVTGVRELSDRLKVDDQIVLLAAYHALLFGYGGEKDVRVGCTVPNRERVEARGLIGCFENTIVVRVPLQDDPTFEELVARTRDAHRAAAAYRDVPLSCVMDELDPTADVSRTALFQAAFSYRTLQRTPESLGAARLVPADLAPVRVPADVHLRVESKDGQLVGALEYAKDLLDEQLAARLVASYRSLLGSALRAPSLPLSALSLIDPQQLAALDALNQTTLAVPNIRGFHELIRAQAERTPDRVAVLAADRTLTYAQLERHSSQLAHLLVARGVTRGARVGIAVGRNSKLLEAALAIVKAGAAYVPLDPEYPADRLAYMIEDARIGLIVTEQSIAARLPAGDFSTLAVEAETEALRVLPEQPPVVDTEPSDAAYVIYTSGSTGRPKGVQVPHGAIANFLCSMAREPGCSESDRLVAVTTLSFDIAVLELYLPLTVGACTIIASRECLVDGRLLAGLIEEHSATLMQATPTTWQLLVDAGWQGVPRFKALCGGEPFPRRLARELIARCESVWNMYGPTETTVWSTCERLVDAEAPILVGKPIANTQLYVLGKRGQRLPFGVPGELYIGGRGVTLGYLDRPELTTERFVPDRFSGEGGARLYRTGDLARQRPQGLELIGRADNQVKLRGHRIELGEIEAVLESDDQVSRAAVLVREFGADDQRLVAYVTKNGDGAIDHDRMVIGLRERLPDYMVPRHFVELERMPLTPNGKIDRKALPLPQQLAAARDRPGEAPTNALETLLAGIWRELLRVESVSVTDDFFDIGGHSLLAYKLVQSINARFNTALPLGFIFESRTVRAQANAINLGRETGGPTVVPLQTGEGAPLFCICGISLYQSLAREFGDERSVYGIFVPSEQLLFEGERRFGLREMASEYVQAIRKTREHGPYYIAGVSFGGSLAYEVAQQLRAAGEEVGFVAILDVVVDAQPPSSQLDWTKMHLARVVEQGPLYFIQRARARLRKHIDALKTEGVTALAFVQRHLHLWTGGAPMNPVAATQAKAEDTDELARLHDIRERHYDSAWAEYKGTIEPFDGNVVVFRARDEKHVGQDTLGEDLGWATLVPAQKLSCHTVPGDHLGILEPPNVRAVAECLRRHFHDSVGDLARTPPMAAE